MHRIVSVCAERKVRLKLYVYWLICAEMTDMLLRDGYVILGV